jgi:hypothetical protein
MVSETLHIRGGFGCSINEAIANGLLFASRKQRPEHSPQCDKKSAAGGLDLRSWLA